MLGNQPFEELYEQLIVRPSTTYRAAIGPPVHLDPQAFDIFLRRLKDFRETYPNMAFWQIADYKNLSIIRSDGDLELFGYKFKTVKDLFRRIHPEYLLPYLRWRGAAYELIHNKNVTIDPLEVALRIALPLELGPGQYYWFNMNSTVVQVDAEGRVVTNLQTLYREGKWSPRSLRPLEASVQIRNQTDADLERQLIEQISLLFIDEFTDGELDLLSLYAAGKAADEVLAAKCWSRHTLHEYNSNLLRKAKALFVYDFRNARDFAAYCLEKGFIKVR